MIKSDCGTAMATKAARGTDAVIGICLPRGFSTTSINYLFGC
ncbi:hypothetical protein [Noviherbaspirillum sedimenti]|nr:hypothetical protein [Noviherbaspirillum sedimenti]